MQPDNSTAFQALLADPRWHFLTGIFDDFVSLEEAWNGYTADEALALAEAYTGGAGI